MIWSKETPKNIFARSSNMRKFGPLRLMQDFDDENETIRCFGPFVASGNVRAKSISAIGPVSINGNLRCEMVSTTGPLTVSEELITYHLKVNGPINVNGNLTLQEGRINGPLTTKHNIEVADYLKLNGSLKAVSVIGKTLIFNGQIDATGSIEASEEIIISVRPGKNQINAKLIKAPTVIIKQSKASMIPRIFRLFSFKNRNSLPSVNVPIEADKLIIDEIQYSGLLKAGNVETYNEGVVKQLLGEGHNE